MNDNKFIEGAMRRTNRRWQSNINRDFDDIVTNFDHCSLLSASRRLFANNGIIRSVIEQKSMYTVGQAMLPKFLGTNKEWKELASDWLTKWYRSADVRGFDLQTFIYLASTSIDMDGDAFILLTETKSGYPQVQAIPAHQIGQRDDEKRVASGTYAGLKIRKGIISAKSGRTIAYRVLGETPDKDKDVSSVSMIHVFDPQYFGTQSRGLPLASHCINTFKDLQQSADLELTKQLMIASLAFVETNAFGGPDPNNPTVEYSCDGKPTCETLDNAGGEIRFFKSGDGSKLDVVSNNNPSNEWQNYQDRLLDAALSGMGWNRSLLGISGGNKGSTDRLHIQIAQHTVRDRQSLLIPVMQRIVSYAIAKAINANLIPFDTEFYKWTFSKPAFISIDLGRDSRAITSEYVLGVRNLTNILAEEGTDIEDHLRQRAVEEAMSIKIRQEVEEAYGVEIDPLNMRLTSSSQYQKTAESIEEEPDNDSTTEEEEEEV